MPSGRAKQYRVWLVFVSTLVTACLSLYMATCLTSLDAELAHRFGLIFGTSTKRLHDGDSLPALMAVVLIACGSCLVGLRLPAMPRLIAWLQLFVVSLLLQWFLSAAHVPGSPCAFVLAILLGGLLGYLQRLFWLREKKVEAQYYELLLRNRELQEARLHLVKQDELDRRMLAADLHDQVLNDLKAVGQKINSLKNNPREDTSKEIDRLLQHAINGVREVMDSLSPAVLEHLGFVAAVEDCLRQASEQNGFKLRFKNSLPPSSLADLGNVEQVLLYRLVQECCTNICKHAEADLVQAVLELDNAQLVIRIIDDGKGIDPSANVNGSRGLKYMRQRADQIGATIAWSMANEVKGTQVQIKLPLAGKR